MSDKLEIQKVIGEMQGHINICQQKIEAGIEPAFNQGEIFAYRTLIRRLESIYDSNITPYKWQEVA
jgi:hypothetical protein